MLGVLVFALCCTAVLAAEQIRIRVLGVPRLQAAPNRWQPLAAALHAAIPAYDFQISTLDETALGQAVRQRQVDFILTTAANYIVIESQSGLSAPLASLVELAGDTQLPVSGGVIFTRAAAGPLHSLPWLANRSIAYVRSAEIGSYLAQAYELFGAGMTPPPRSMGALAVPNDAEVVNAVLSGRAQAGFVPAGVLERMAAHGQLDWAAIRLVNEQRLPALSVQGIHPPLSGLGVGSPAASGFGRTAAGRAVSAGYRIEHGAGGAAGDSRLRFTGQYRRYRQRVARNAGTAL
jgi:ABC-type phosphate/phosphonate transport system substrate-binding protein